VSADTSFGDLAVLGVDLLENGLFSLGSGFHIRNANRLMARFSSTYLQIATKKII
jgi:hypothetical protein